MKIALVLALNRHTNFCFYSIFFEGTLITLLEYITSETCEQMLLVEFWISFPLNPEDIWPGYVADILPLNIDDGCNTVGT